MARIRLATPFDLSPFTDLVRAALPVEASERPLGHMNIDVVETPEAFVIDAELPGVAKDAIHVTVEGDRVDISAEAKPRSLAEGQRMLVRERHEGLFFRSFRLPQDVDADKATARYADGVLELTLPKKKGAGRRLAIQ